jgi:predicted transcriptional regulator
MEIIEGLQSLGVNRNVAQLITYLSNVKESSSKDIEMSTGLRQPEVSIAMRPLREIGWISERDVKTSGKGRPMKIYALKTTMKEIIEHYETEKNRANEAIQKLKEFSPAR